MHGMCHESVLCVCVKGATYVVFQMSVAWMATFDQNEARNGKVSVNDHQEKEHRCPKHMETENANLREGQSQPMTL